MNEIDDLRRRLDDLDRGLDNSLRARWHRFGQMTVGEGLHRLGCRIRRLPWFAIVMTTALVVYFGLIGWTMVSIFHDR